MRSGDYKLVFRLPVPDEGGRVGLRGIELPALAEALASSGSTVAASPGPADPCDLLVAAAPESGAGEEFFRSLAASLAPGGAAAVIAANPSSLASLAGRLRGRRWRGGAAEASIGSLARAARSAGLRMADAFALIPDERNPSVIVAARDARGLGFVLAHFPDFASGRSRAAVRIARLLVGIGFQAPFPGRYVAIFRDAAADGPLPGLLARTPGAACVTRVEVDTQAVLCFLFEAGERVPSSVLKAASEPGRNDELRRERDNLAAVRAAIPEPFASSVPAVRGSGVWRGRFHYRQEFSRGAMLGASLDGGPFGARRGRVAADLGRAWEWLAGFQSATDGGARPVGELGIAASLARYAAAHAGGEDRAAIAWLAAGIERHAGRAVPVSACHGDFFPGNVLLGRDRVSVIDWRYFRPRHHRCFDVMTLLSTLRPRDRAAGGEGGGTDDFERLFCRSHWTNAWFRERLGAFFAKNGLDGELFAFLCGTALLEMSIRELSETGAPGGKDAVWRGRLLRFEAVRGRIAVTPDGAGSPGR